MKFSVAHFSFRAWKYESNGVRVDSVSAILAEKNESGRRYIMEKKTFELFEISANRRSLSHFRSKKNMWDLSKQLHWPIITISTALIKVYH